ncbi:MAG: S4 domain-containing protein [Candidatus Micrarchaeia archaeon]
MGIKGNSRHIKALNAPSYFPTERKGFKYVAKQNPGRFNLARSVSLIVALRKMLEEGNGPLRTLIKEGGVKVNGSVIRDIKYPVGINDVISIEKSKRHFAIGINDRAKFSYSELKEEPKEKIRKIVGKYKAKMNKIMIRLDDGTVIDAPKNADVNDSIKINNEKKVANVIKAKEGAKCIIIDGIHVGSQGVIKSLQAGTSIKQASAQVQGSDGTVFETLLKNIMIVE